MLWLLLIDLYTHATVSLLCMYLYIMCVYFVCTFQNTKIIKDEFLILIIFCMVAIDLIALLTYTGMYILTLYIYCTYTC